MSNKKSQECLTIFFFQGGVVKNLVPCLLLTIFFSPMRWYVFPARQWMNFSFKSPLIWQIGVLSTVGGKLAYNLGVAILVHLYGLWTIFFVKTIFWWLQFLKRYIFQNNAWYQYHWLRAKNVGNFSSSHQNWSLFSQHSKRY